ncbi:hypothetical protein GGQ74_003101 [Desulfobaculum xiamenense]|uniref:C2H2-type domain-containing protein n=1 Tax=Desulfobaculum xiamenense TaxID=995050 RepID=A0A846QXP5_9BACT|nr:cytochrome c3 family protein [Desulfobaculum xiamenense]NJB69399.1 hypothetical protein [Desulfobaculum xiamenense]
MKRKISLILCAAALACVWLVPAGATSPKAPQEPITIEVPEGNTPTKPPVVFPHLRHEALDCTACHHKWDKTADIVKCKNSGCHDQFPDKKSDRSHYRAYHAQGKQSCLGCHKEMKKEKAATGPVVCKECHKE